MVHESIERIDKIKHDDAGSAAFPYVSTPPSVGQLDSVGREGQKWQSNQESLEESLPGRWILARDEGRLGSNSRRCVSGLSWILDELVLNNRTGPDDPFHQMTWCDSF